MGAGTSALAAAAEPDIQALVLDSPYAKASELVAQETARKTFFPEWFVPIFVPGAGLAADLLFDIDLGALVPEKAVADIDYPILVIHGLADTRIPTEHGIRVHMASHPESSLWLVPEVDHVDAFLTLPEEYAERVAAYFAERLGAASE
jgi:pimeloyl-ACP methyl ester carboxylesterase